MKIEVVSDNVRLLGVHEIIYEISINDDRFIYIRKTVFEKLNIGEYMLQINGFMISIIDRNNGKLVDKLTNSIY